MIAAGRNTVVADEGTDKCLTIPSPPGTPEGTRRWRKSNFAEAGQKVVHPGLINDVAKMNPFTKYGKVTADSDHVENVFGHGPSTQFGEYNNDKAESCYASKKMEPLGKSFSRGHLLPEQARNPNFAFGIPTGCSESSKNLLYPTETEDESKHSGMYTKSHGSYAPGEQRNRDYNWEKTDINEKTHRFGKKEKNMLKNGVALCMNPANDKSVPKTRLVATKVENMKNTKDQLGKARNLGMGTTGLQQEHIFGVQGTLDSWDAQACIQGDYSAEEQQPDSDLGTSATPGWRNTTIEQRAFGCPTLRTDIRNPAAKSVSDNQNYGDDVDAQFLLYPSNFAFSGVEDADFAEPRSQETIQKFFGQLFPPSFSAEDFEQVWQSAEAGSLTPFGTVSVSEFQEALNKFQG